MWFSFLLLPVLFASLVTRGQCINTCVDPGSDNYRCSVGGLFLFGCGLTDDDLGDVAACFDTVGRSVITVVFLDHNLLEVLPATLFQGMTNMGGLIISNNNLKEVPSELFQDQASLSGLSLGNNKLSVLPVDTFQALTSLALLELNGNLLTTLPHGLFDGLPSLTTLVLNQEDSSARTNDIQCLPSLSSNPTISSVTPAGTCGCALDGMSDAEAVELLCGADMTCQSGTTGYMCESSAGGTGDPHMVGFSGQTFDFTGNDGSWYAVLKDGPAHINMRVTAPLRELDVITYITGISIIAPDLDGHMHTMEIYVEDPHTLDYGCPVGLSPCLANGALTILLDSVEVVSPSEVTLGRGVLFGSVNLPGECRPFGFEKYWERKVREAQEEDAEHGRRLEDNAGISMAEWILSDRLATNKPECEAYVNGAGGDLFAHQSEHASFQLNTPTFTMRLNYGKLHQLAVRDPTNQFDLPDHLTHQMNLGLSRVMLGKFPEGILGETAAVRTDFYDMPIMTGTGVISGNEEDYKVDGALGTKFKQASN